MSRKGIIVFNHPDDGRIVAESIDLPVDTNMTAVAWALDLCRKINEHSKVRRFLLHLVLGKYAWRELVGLRDSIGKEWDTSMEYSCEECKYHKDKVSWEKSE